MDISPERINDQYLKIFVVSQAVIAPVWCKLFAVDNRFDIARELNTDTISHWNPVFHIKEKLLHRALSSIPWATSQVLFLKRLKGQLDLPMAIAFRA